MGSPEEEFPPGSVDYVLHIITREEWKAKDWELEEKLKNLPKLPYKIVLDHFTCTEPCTTYEDCVRIVQAMQEKDMSRGYNDIKYNFLIGGDGMIYEGRGWHVCSSRSLKNFIKMWRKRLDIAFIGNYLETPIPDVMMERFREVIDFGIKEDIIKRFPTSFHIRKGIENIPVEGTMDDFLRKAVLGTKKREEEADVVLRDERQRKEDIEEGRVEKRAGEKELPYSDGPSASYYKNAYEEKTRREIRQIKDKFWKTIEIYRT